MFRHQIDSNRLHACCLIALVRGRIYGFVPAGNIRVETAENDRYPKSRLQKTATATTLTISERLCRVSSSVPFETFVLSFDFPLQDTAGKLRLQLNLQARSSGFDARKPHAIPGILLDYEIRRRTQGCPYITWSINQASGKIASATRSSLKFFSVSFSRRRKQRLD